MTIWLDSHIDKDDRNKTTGETKKNGEIHEGYVPEG